MAYLTLGPEFYRDNPKLYNSVLSRVKGIVKDQILDFKFIYFDSDKYGKDEHCIAVIKESTFHRKPYFKQIISYKYQKV